MEENLMNDVVETAADNVVTVTETLPGYSAKQVGIAAGVSFVAGVIACKVAKPVWRKIKGVFRKDKVTKDDFEVVEDAEFEENQEET